MVGIVLVWIVLDGPGGTWWLDGNGDWIDIALVWIVLLWIVLVLDDIDGLIGNGTESTSVALIEDGGFVGRIVLI